MEVVVQSTLSTTQGRVIVATDASQTVDSLITAFCIEKGIPHRKHLVLYNKELQVLSNTKKLSTVGIQNGDVLYLGYKETSDQWPCGCNQWWLISIVALLIAAGGLIAISILYTRRNDILYEYGVVIDAGSTHSQLYAYRWNGGKQNGTAVPEQIYSHRIVPGIGNYTDDPSAAGKSLEPMLQEAEQSIPKKDLSQTPIYLGATAGMRLLEASNKSVSDAIMNSTRTSISKFGFDFVDPQKQARILDGQAEAAYSWVTVNYLSGVFSQVASGSLFSFFKSAPRTKGALDLGGASTEISFERAPEVPTPDYLNLIMYGSNYNIYAKSYLCFGINEAYRQHLAYLIQELNSSSAITINDPCSPRGSNYSLHYSKIFEVPCTANKSIPEDKDKTYQFLGSSNVTQCAQSIKEVFSDCVGSWCPLNGRTEPPLDGEFLAFSGFYYTMEYLNLTHEGGNISLSDFEAAYKDLCKRNKSQISLSSSSDALPDIPHCFRAVYIHSLLLDVYGFNETTWNSLSFVKKINNSELGWALGYMLNASNAIPEEYPTREISTVMFVLLMLLFAAFILIAVGFACHARNSGQAGVRYHSMATYGTI